VKLSRRLQLVERIAERHHASEPSVGVCDRIEELTTAYLTNPPTFAPAVEAGIRATVERQLRAVERFCPAPMEDRP
jgi:chorismate mutase